MEKYEKDINPLLAQEMPSEPEQQPQPDTGTPEPEAPEPKEKEAQKKDQAVGLNVWNQTLDNTRDARTIKLTVNEDYKFGQQK